MELVQGAGLDDLHGLTYARIVDLGVQICAALAYAHELGFIHRDLKLANVLVEKRGFNYFAKLADFGLARPLDAADLPSESNLAGTVFYLAPEVIAGKPAHIGSDLYALGAMLYQMITGRVPFSDFFDYQTILTQHLEEPVTPPSHSRDDLPPALETIVMRLLAKDPQERFASAQAVRLALEQIETPCAPGRMRGNLPPGQISTAGQENKIEQVIKLLETNQMVTLLGQNEPLVLATGAQLASQFPAGVWRVDVASLPEPAQILPAVATTFGICKNPQRALTISLIEELRQMNLLLILCNCHHHPEACAQLAETILTTCQDVHILASSEQSLHVSGEQSCHFE
jgi:serine/threonine protein kinase